MLHQLQGEALNSSVDELHQLQGEALNSSVDDIFGMLKGVWLK